jgi:hypothetical protein
MYNRELFLVSLQQHQLPRGRLLPLTQEKTLIPAKNHKTMLLHDGDHNRHRVPWDMTNLYSRLFW